MNTFKFNNKKYWCGCVSLIDGIIEEVHKYQTAMENDFHHSFYFSIGSIEKMDNEESTFFWVDEKGNIQLAWRNNNNDLNIVNAIKNQIKICV